MRSRPFCARHPASVSWKASQFLPLPSCAGTVEGGTIHRRRGGDEGAGEHVGRLPRSSSQAAEEYHRQRLFGVLSSRPGQPKASIKLPPSSL